MTTVTRITTGRLSRLVRRVRQLRRTRGNGRVLYAILRRLAASPGVRRCVRLCAADIWRLRLAEVMVPARTPQSYMTRIAQRRDLNDLVEYYGDRARVVDRFERGELCVITVFQNQLAAALWLSVGPNESAEDWDDLRCTFRFPEHVAWTYDGKGTRLGAWGTLMAHLPRVLGPMGVEQIATVIDCNNWQSIDAHRRLGYWTEGILGCVNVLGMVVRFFKPVGQRWQRLPDSLGNLQLGKHAE